MPSTNRWVKTRPGNAFSWEERRPYKKCPNCGRHEYRQMRQLDGVGILAFFFGTDKHYRKYKSCKHCKYSTEITKEKIDGN